MRLSGSNHQGSVVLVALCYVAVVGIALASYLAVCNQAMRLSNRSFYTGMSKGFSEMGLERALLAFKQSDWSGWTISGTTATRTLTIADTQYGNSKVSGTIKLRVDRRNATKTWNSTTSYTTNDLVYHRGVWFQCIGAHSNQSPPNTTYWASAPSAWNSSATYTRYSATVGDIVIFGNAAYRCILTHTNQLPTNTTYWTSVSIANWNSGTSYSVNSLALYNGTAYRARLAHSNQAPPNPTYWIGPAVIYAEGTVTLPNNTGSVKTQLRAEVAPAALFPNAIAASSDVFFRAGGTIDSYNSSTVIGVWNNSTPYAVNDVVYSTGATPDVYRCILAHTGRAVSNATYWVRPVGYSAVVAGGDTASAAVALNTVRVNGYVAAPSTAASPYGPNYTNATNAIVTGSALSTVTPAPRIDLTRISRSPYIPQFTPTSAPAGSISLAPITTALTLPRGGDVAASDGKYYYSINGDIYLYDASDILTINSSVVIYATGVLHTSNGKIVISPTGSAEIHFGSQLYVGNNTGGGIDNSATKDPKKCVLIGTSTGNSYGNHYYWSTMPFYGVIYMPNAYVAIWQNVVTYGAISAKNVDFRYATVFHYDTTLRTASIPGVETPYQITSWRELTSPTEQLTF